MNISILLYDNHSSFVVCLIIITYDYHLLLLPYLTTSQKRIRHFSNTRVSPKFRFGEAPRECVRVYNQLFGR